MRFGPKELRNGRDINQIYKVSLFHTVEAYRENSLVKQSLDATSEIGDAPL